MEKTFEREVLDRLIVLETLIKEQDYKGIQKTSEESNNRSIENEKRISKLEDKNTWLIRLVFGAVILGILAFVYGM